MSGLPALPAVVAALALLAGPSQLAGQIDYRNLDDDRPTVIEDAYPVERYAFEILLPYRFEREPGGGVVHAAIPELAGGLLPNFQLGLKVPIAVERSGGVTTRGLSGLRVFALYNFNTESRVLPAVSLRFDLALPAGPLGGDVTRAAVKAITTRSWGRNRIHLNAAYSVGRAGVAAAAEPLSRWWAGAAVDRTLFRHSTLVVGEVYAAQAERGSRAEVVASVGVRRQVTPTTVLDLGIARGLRDGPSAAFTVGLSHAFAVAAIMPGGGR